MRQVKAFFRDENGATAIEYGLIAALLGVGIIAAWSNAGAAIGAKFNTIASNLSSGS